MHRPSTNAPRPGRLGRRGLLAVTAIMGFAVAAIACNSATGLTDAEITVIARANNQAPSARAQTTAIPPTEVPAEIRAEVEDHLTNARDYSNRQQYGLALVELEQADALLPFEGDTLLLRRQVSASATAQAQQANAAATATARQALIILDVPSLMGKSAAEVRAIFGAPRRVEAVRPNVLDNLPGGGESWNYTKDQWFGDLLMDRTGKLAAMLVFMTPNLRSYDDALLRLGLPTGQPPSSTAPIVRRWNNLAGSYVQLRQQSLNDTGIDGVVIGPRR